MTKAKEITQAEIEVFNQRFMVKEGVLRYKIDYRAHRVGGAAGNLSTDGYVVVKVNGRALKAHRICWCMYHGEEPKGMLDHIDKDKLNNSRENLRTVTNQINQRNCRKQTNSTSGVTGVTWYKKGSVWGAHIKIEGKTLHLGTFGEKQHAVDARRVAELVYGFTND